jgi:hypothetical protein
MKVSETLLRRLSDWRPAGSGRHVLAAADPAAGWTATLTAERVDSMGCLLWEVLLTRTAPPAAAITLERWAADTVAAVTGLLEPLKLIEHDTTRNEALLRSHQPSERADHLYYFEVLLRGTESASLRRFQSSHEPGSHRQQVAFALTMEAIAKLVDDLTGQR